jgi:hypothetical protein
MPLDETTRRFAFLMQRDLRRLEERLEGRSKRGEAMRADSVSRVVTWETRLGEVAARQYTEVLATYEPRDRILRWGWAGRSPSSSASHGDTIVREAQARGVPQLAMSVVADLTAEEAEELARLGAILARAETVVSRPGPASEIEFVGLFDRSQPDARDRYSVPPPPVIESDGKPEAKHTPPPPYRSLPPVREVYAPRAPRTEGRSSPPHGTTKLPRVGSSRPPGSQPVEKSPSGRAAERGAVREPSRALFVPVANAAIRALVRECPGYTQGLFVVTVSAPPRADQPRRVVVQLVAIDPKGMLRALDPPRELVEAAAEMTDADRREGNGIWRKLSARIVPKADGGATLNVEVT